MSTGHYPIYHLDSSVLFASHFFDQLISTSLIFLII
jgi:hypothetical protein